MRRAFLIGALWLAILSGCGTVGPPIPPEDIGVAAKLEKEKARAKLQPPPEKDKDEDRPEDEEQQLSLPR
ncbi:MAG: hypothetical protein EPO61_01765 [Nitrospirae bacterium]|nr:MAG: hypothetical protein EPO61_01765 [Nitrospirota bacterium]